MENYTEEGEFVEWRIRHAWSYVHFDYWTQSGAAANVRCIISSYNYVIRVPQN